MHCGDLHSRLGAMGKNSLLWLHLVTVFAENDSNYRF